jgi:hypothetical protein
MKKEIAEKWVEALRSGKFNQGRNYLKRTTGEEATHCCLGVLCELHNELNEETIEESSMWLGETGDKDSVHAFDGATGALSERVQKWSGIKSAIGSVGEDCLTTMNDDAENSFIEIADFIEKNIDNL